MSDDYDEDFENYGSDFEEDVEVHHAVGQPSPKAASPKQDRAAAHEQPAAAQQRQQHQQPHQQVQHQHALPDASATALFAVSLPTAPVLTDAEQRRAAVTLRRSRALMAQVQLSEVGVSEAFRMEARSAYELYSQGRGEYANRRVAATQTSALGQDAMDGECQTEEIDICDATCQAPDNPAAASARGGEASTSTSQSSKGRALTSSSNDARLAPFLDWACPTILAQLARTPAAGFSGRGSTAAARFSSSTGSISSQLSGGREELFFPGLLTGRRVTALAYAHTASSEPPVVCAAYSAVAMDEEAALRDHSMATLGVMCVWDVARPAVPVHVLASEGQAVSCCWGPAGSCAELVFAGMDEGCVCAWDLSERSSLHPAETISGRQLPLRRPSYTTEAATDPGSCGAVVAVAALARSVDGGGAGVRAGGCQLVAMTAWGHVSMFAVVQLGAGDMAAADTDKGVRTGSRVRLVRTHAGIRLGLPAIQPLHLLPPKTHMPQLIACSLQVLPGGSQQLLVGADGGRVLRGACLGLPSAPREYKPHVYRPPLVAVTSNSSLNSSQGDAAEALLSKVQPPSTSSSSGSHVLSLHLSPFCPDAFLSAHDNGTLLLHSATRAHAVMWWPDVSTCGLVTARWSPSRPCVFLALDQEGTLLCFDLLQTTTGPVSISPANQQGGAADAAKAILLEVAVSCRSGDGDSDCNSSNSSSSGTMATYMLGFDDGRAECHLLPKELAVAQPGELEVLQALLA